MGVLRKGARAYAACVSRGALAAVVAFLLAACSSPAAVATVAPVTRAPESPITVSGAAKTGVSKSFSLAGGSYSVEWEVTAPKGGCYFFLYLATKANGPSVESADGILTSGGSQHALADWTAVPAGKYVLQEDRTGIANCTGAWSATLQPE